MALHPLDEPDSNSEYTAGEQLVCLYLLVINANRDTNDQVQFNPWANQNPGMMSTLFAGHVQEIFVTLLGTNFNSHPRRQWRLGWDYSVMR